MGTLLQINSSINTGSTGRIAEHINQLAQKKGWDTFFAYGRRYNSSSSTPIKVGSKFNVYEHYLEHLVFDNDGLASRRATRLLIHTIERITPNIIHLHNIHDHWLNYKLLFEYLNTLNIPVVWTFHDCWAFTGGCAHFTCIDCYRWRDYSCDKPCPMKRHTRMRRLFENTGLHFQLKRELFTKTNNLTIVPVSHWLEGVVRESFLKDKNIITIHNGTDLSLFRPLISDSVRSKYGIQDSHYVLGVNSVWLPYKGWADFLRMAQMLPKDIKLVLVGLPKDKIQAARKVGIIGIPHTEDINELAALYSGAEAFLNFSREETLGMTSIEAMACGTPCIVYNSTAVPEPIISKTGFIVEPGNLCEVRNAISEIIGKGKEYYSKNCRAHVEQNFDKNDCFSKYINLYETLID